MCLLKLCVEDYCPVRALSWHARPSCHLYVPRPPHLSEVMMNAQKKGKQTQWATVVDLFIVAPVFQSGLSPPPTHTQGLTHKHGSVYTHDLAYLFVSLVRASLWGCELHGGVRRFAHRLYIKTSYTSAWRHHMYSFKWPHLKKNELSIQFGGVVFLRCNKSAVQWRSVELVHVWLPETVKWVWCWSETD